MQTLGWSLILSIVLCVFYVKVFLPRYKGKYTEEGSAEALPPYMLVIGFALATMVFILVITRGGEGAYLAGNLFVAAILLIISAIDLNFRKIPNELVLIISLPAVFFWINGTGHILEALIGGVLASFLLIAAKLLRGRVGAGDIKLMFSVGFYLGMWLAVGFFVVTFALAAFVSAVLLFLEKATRKEEVPLAPFATVSFALIVCFDIIFMEYWRIIL